MTKAAMELQMIELQATLAALQNGIPKAIAKAKAEPEPEPAPLTLRVSQKGAISVYGLGRFPMTLYKNQMLRVLAIADQIRAFIDANSDSLTTK